MGVEAGVPRCSHELGRGHHRSPDTDLPTAIPTDSSMVFVLELLDLGGGWYGPHEMRCFSTNQRARLFLVAPDLRPSPERPVLPNLCQETGHASITAISRCMKRTQLGLVS